MNFLSAKYNVAARYVNYMYEYRRVNASCTVKCHCRGGGRRGGGGGGGGRNEVGDRDTMFSQLEKRSPCVVVSG